MAREKQGWHINKVNELKATSEGGLFRIVSQQASQNAGPLQGAYVVTGVNRSAVLCNTLKLMLCNKWANPPESLSIMTETQAT